MVTPPCLHRRVQTHGPYCKALATASGIGEGRWAREAGHCPVSQTCKTSLSAKKTSGQAYQTQAPVGFAAGVASDVPAARSSISDGPPNPAGNMSGPAFSSRVVAAESSVVWSWSPPTSRRWNRGSTTARERHCPPSPSPRRQARWWRSQRPTGQRARSRSMIADLFRSAIIVAGAHAKAYADRRGILTAQPPASQPRGAQPTRACPCLGPQHDCGPV